MRKLILAMHMSLDWLISGPNGELDWARSQESDADVDSDLKSLVDRADTVLIGRVLYEWFAWYWPNAHTINPNLSEPEKYFASWIETAQKVVISTTLENPQWSNSTVIKNSIVEEINKLKQTPGKDIIMFWWARTAQEFARLGLIDEYHLDMHPVILGKGVPLFKDISEMKRLNIIEIKPYSSWVVALRYEYPVK